MICCALGNQALALQSIARIWNEKNLAAIRIDRPHPPVQARNLFTLSVAMYDAWAAYDPVAVGYVYRGKHHATDLAAARREAISYAAYRVLRERYALSLNPTATRLDLDAEMGVLGYDKNNTSIDLATPASVGNSVAASVSGWFLSDGARQAQSYADYPANQGGYVPINSPLVTKLPGTTVADVNRWQRLTVDNALDQNGNPIPSTQSYLGPQWLGVRPFVLGRADAAVPWIDPGPQPRLGGAGDAQFRSDVLEIIRRSSELTPDDGVMIDISPGLIGNNTLGMNDGIGRPINPATNLPYPANVVRRGDFARVLSEFWADGPNSETPPGHWNTIANAVGDHPSFGKRLGGSGPVLDDLEWDVKLYFALNASLREAACAAWSLKRYYEGGRPITFIRYMAGLGQSSFPAGPRYHLNGLPLVPGLIEQVTAATAQTGQRHAGLPVDSIAILAWPGQPPDSLAEHSGVRWIEAVRWLPYQKETFVTPAFPGYVSGHSTFSRSAAEVLAAITGSPFFPGGIGLYTAAAGSGLTFEEGPSATVQLQWATYFDAADQAGLSRLWGGIHVPVDDLTGRRVGAECGRSVWALARQYFDGSVLSAPPDLSLRFLSAGELEIRCTTRRGLFYKLQSTPDLALPFTDEPGGLTRAFDATAIRTGSSPGRQRFYRIVSALEP
ncbi:MAG: hypothetical protein JWL90_1838 [Chthoniobacteraceae bacterium]|nr:hypothetical protein [Chthoniobacteraceae bacterium]